MEIHHTVRRGGGHRDAAVAAQAGAVGGQHLLDQVELADEQRGDAAGIIGDEAEADALPRILPGRRGKLDALADLVRDQAMGAGADQAAAGVEIDRMKGGMEEGLLRIVARAEGSPRHHRR